MQGKLNKKYNEIKQNVLSSRKLVISVLPFPESCCQYHGAVVVEALHDGSVAALLH